jgi:hypothetical protein
VELQLAGFYDPDVDPPKVAAGMPGEPTLRGQAQAIERREEAPAGDAATPIPPVPAPAGKAT